MKKIFTLALAFYATNVLCQKNNADYLITNVSIIPMTTEIVIANQDVAIKNGKIISISDSKKRKFDAKQIIDGKGKFILPTLSDAHIHLPEQETELEKYLTLNLINGVTRLRSMRGDWKHLEWKKKFNTENSFFPKIYLTAPPIHNTHDLTKENMANFVNAAKENNINLIKILSIKNQKMFVELDSICKIHDIKITGHFPSNPKGVLINDELIFNSNYNSIEHLGGLIGEKETFESRLKSIKEKNIFISPTLQWYVVGYGQLSVDQMKNQRGMEFISPETLKDWTEKTTLYREKMGKQAFEEEVAFYGKELEERHQVINRLNSEGIKLLLSPDSSSKFIVPGFGVLEEMNNYKKSGLSNYDILKATTINFAEYYNDNTFGTIAENKNADFIILNQNPLENLKTLENIQGIFFNNNYIDKIKIEELEKANLSK